MTACCGIIAGWQRCSLQDQEEDRPEEVDGGVLRAPKLADGPDPLSLGRKQVGRKPNTGRAGNAR